MGQSESARQEYASFLVRMWREVDLKVPDGGTPWHGEIEHIQSGRHVAFRTLDEVRSIFRQHAEGAIAHEQHGQDVREG